jgi:hypothetical protein
MNGRVETSVQLPVCDRTATGLTFFFPQQPKVSNPPADHHIGVSIVETMVPQREDHTPHWSRGDLVKVRPKTAGATHMY